MKKSLLFITILTLAITGCNKSETTTPAPQGDNGTTIPLSEALSNLDNLLSQLDIDTKASHSRTYSIQSVSDFGGQDICKTKATGIDIPDALMYLVNFDDAEGFAVLAADRRLGESIYCITENGTISKSDFTEAFDYLQSDVSLTKSSSSDDYDGFTDLGKKFVPALMLSSMLKDLKYGTQFVKDSLRTEEPEGVKGNILLKTKWGQNSPFNDLIPNKYPTGCVATACAQIMQCCHKPSYPVYNGVYCVWELMNTVCNTSDPYGRNATGEAKKYVANFLYHIGGHDYCRIEYGANGSSGYASGVVRTLKKYGYSNVKKHLGFGNKNQGRASSMLRNKLPVYIDGVDWHHGKVGHAWVLDGEWNGYFHCNWGWNGEWDGYYAKHNYFPIDYREHTDVKDPGTTNSLGWHCYDWGFSIITYSL